MKSASSAGRRGPADGGRAGCGAGGAGEHCAAGQLAPRRGTGSVPRPGASTICPPDTAAALPLSRPAGAAKDLSAANPNGRGPRSVVGRFEAMSQRRGWWYWPVEPGLSWLNPIENWGINRDKTDGCGPLCSNLPLTVVRNHEHLSSQDDKVRLPPGGGVGGTTLRTKRAIVATVAAIGTVVLAAGCSSSSSSSGSAAANTSSSGSSSASAANFTTCDSAAACGGMSALVAEAKKEGQLNVITLPSNWANYGNIMKGFTARVRDQDHRREPRGLQPGRAERGQAAQGPEQRPGRR